MHIILRKKEQKKKKKFAVPTWAWVLCDLVMSCAHRWGLPSWLKLLGYPPCPGVARASVCPTRNAEAPSRLMCTSGPVSTVWKRPWSAAVASSTPVCSKLPGVAVARAYARSYPLLPSYSSFAQQADCNVHSTAAYARPMNRKICICC